MFDRAAQMFETRLFIRMRDVAMVIQKQAAQECLSWRRGRLRGPRAGASGGPGDYSRTPLGKRGCILANPVLFFHSKSRSAGQRYLRPLLTACDARRPGSSLPIRQFAIKMHARQRTDWPFACHSNSRGVQLRSPPRVAVATWRERSTRRQVAKPKRIRNRGV